MATKTPWYVSYRTCGSRWAVSGTSNTNSFRPAVKWPAGANVRLVVISGMGFAELVNASNGPALRLPNCKVTAPSMYNWIASYLASAPELMICTCPRSVSCVLGIISMMEKGATSEYQHKFQNLRLHCKLCWLDSVVYPGWGTFLKTIYYLKQTVYVFILLHFWFVDQKNDKQICLLLGSLNDEKCHSKKCHSWNGMSKQGLYVK